VAVVGGHGSVSCALRPRGLSVFVRPQFVNIKSSSLRSCPALVFNQSLCPMGCFASKPAVHPSPSISTAPPLWSEGPSHSHEANRDASRAPASSSRPNVATQAPPSPSEHAPDRAIRDPRLTAQPRSQAPFTGNTTSELKSPQRGELASSSPHNEETSVPSYQGAAGTTTSLLVQPNIEHNMDTRLRKPGKFNLENVPLPGCEIAMPTRV